MSTISFENDVDRLLYCSFNRSILVGTDVLLLSWLLLFGHRSLRFTDTNMGIDSSIGTTEVWVARGAKKTKATILKVNKWYNN